MNATNKNTHVPCEACSEYIALLEPSSQTDDGQIYLAQIEALRSPWRSKARDNFPCVEACTCGDEPGCCGCMTEELKSPEELARMEAELVTLKRALAVVREAVEGERDPHMLHEACDEAAIRSLEASLENPEPPTLEALEELQAPEYAPDAVTVQANRDHEGICEMLLEAPVEVPTVDWDALLPENAVWADAEPAHYALPYLCGDCLEPVEIAHFCQLEHTEPAPSPAKPAHDGIRHWTVNAGELQTEYRLPEPVTTPKVRDISPMFDTPEADLEDEEFNAAEWELANTYTSDPDDQAVNDALLDAITDEDFIPAPDADELAELRAKGLDPSFCHIIGAACSV